MSNEDCITLSDTDDDDELEILDEKITNYGSASTQPKQLELSKDDEQTILASLRKQNMSIPKGNFKLKIYAKNGGNVDLSTLDLSSISNSSLSVKNKLSTTGKSTFIVSATSAAMHEKEETKKESTTKKDLVKKHSCDAKKKTALNCKESYSLLRNEKVVGSGVEHVKKAAVTKDLRSDNPSIVSKSAVKAAKCKTTEKKKGEPDAIVKKKDKSENVVSFTSAAKSVAPAPASNFELQKSETINLSHTEGDLLLQENHVLHDDNFKSPSDSKKTINEQMDSIKTSDRDISFEPRKGDVPGLFQDASKGVESFHQAVDYTCSVVDKVSPVIMNPRIRAEDPSQAFDGLCQAMDSSTQAVNTLGQTMEAESLADDGHPCPAVDEGPNVVDASPVMTNLSINVIDNYPSAAIDDYPSGAVDEDPSAAVDDDPSAAVDDDPSAAVDDDPSAAVDDDPSAAVDDDPSAAADVNPREAVDDNPSAAAVDDNPSAVDDDPSATIDDYPIAVDDDPSPLVDYAPGTGVDDDPSPAINDDPNAAVDVISVVAVDDAPGAAVDDAPSPAVDAAPVAAFDDVPPPAVDDTPPPAVDNAPSPAINDILSRTFDGSSPSPSPSIEEALGPPVCSSRSVGESSPLFDDSRLLADDQISSDDDPSLGDDIIETTMSHESAISSSSDNIGSLANKQRVQKENLDSRTSVEDNEHVTEEGIAKKRKSEDGYEAQVTPEKRIRSKIPIVQSPNLFEEILDITADCASKENEMQTRNTEVESIEVSTACRFVTSESTVDVATKECNFDVNNEEPILMHETMDGKEKPIDVASISTTSDHNYDDHFSPQVLDDSGIFKLLKATDENDASLDNLDLGDEDIGESISYEMDVDEEYALTTIKNILGTISDGSSNWNGEESWELQVVPNLEEYIERNVDNYLDTIPFDTQNDTFDDIFKAALPTNNPFKSVVADTLFEHDDLVLESDNTISSLDIGIVPTDEEYLDNDFIDISSKFSDLETSGSTLSDIEEFLKETELESIESFVSVEVLQNLVGNNIDMNQVLWELKGEAHLHFKFSGWKITHVSKKAAKIITDEDIEVAEEDVVAFKENINLQKDDLLYDSENLLQEEVPGTSDSLNKSLSERTQNMEENEERFVPIVNDDAENHGREGLENDYVDADNDNREKNCWVKDLEDVSVWNKRSCFVSLKNIPLSEIPESTPSMDADIECSSKYPSSVAPLSTSGPKDFLWQLDSREFSTMFGLCTHSQADEMRAKPSAPSGMRLRRVNQGNPVKYNVMGNARKKREQRKSIEL